MQGAPARLVPLLVVAAALAGCAQVLGLDDRSVGDAAPPDARADATTKPDGKSGSDATTKPDAAKHDAHPVVDARSADDVVEASGDVSTGEDHHAPDAGSRKDAAHDGSAAHDAANDTGLTACEGGAVDLETDPDHCGACAHVCTLPDAGLKNSQATCAGAVCGVGCATGWGDCNDGGTGCRFNLSSDPANCGGCGLVCGNASTAADPTCVSGACVFDCSPGFAHCALSESNGCETDIASSSDNCGSCGYSCGAGVPCVQGVCKLTTGSENIGGQAFGVSALVQDSTTAAGGSLYWANTGGSSGGALRTIHKDGSGLTSLSSYPDIPGESQGLTLTVDENYVYYFTTGGTLSTKSPRRARAGSRLA